jgi:hypothetical protein
MEICLNKSDYGKGLTNLTLTFSNTKPNEKVITSGTFIDFRGNIYGPKSTSITIQGGDDKGIYAVNSLEPTGFYMTISQKKTIMQILKGMAETSDTATISSENGQLQELCLSIYNNYIG